MNIIKHYNHQKYWEMRQDIFDNKKHKIILYYYLIRIKRMDAYSNASTGIDIGGGAQFATPPNLPHGLNGIFISPLAKIGKECFIHQQVTIASDQKGHAAVIGDYCVIGAGAKIMGNAKLGNNVIVGANAVVTKEFPDNVVIGGIPATIIGNYDPKIHRWVDRKLNGPLDE